MQRLGAFVVGQNGEVIVALAEQVFGGIDGTLYRTIVFGNAYQNRQIERLLIDDACGELHALGIAGGFKQIQDRQG